MHLISIDICCVTHFVQRTYQALSHFLLEEKYNQDVVGKQLFIYSFYFPRFQFILWKNDWRVGGWPHLRYSSVPLETEKPIDG